VSPVVIDKDSGEKKRPADFGVAEARWTPLSKEDESTNASSMPASAEATESKRWRGLSRLGR